MADLRRLARLNIVQAISLDMPVAEDMWETAGGVCRDPDGRPYLCKSLASQPRGSGQASQPDEAVELIRRAAPFVNAVAALADNKSPALAWLADATIFLSPEDDRLAQNVTQKIELARQLVQSEPDQEDPTEGLPPDLARVLRDSEVIVSADAAVFELIAGWMDAPSDTMSALPPDKPSQPEQEAGE